MQPSTILSDLMPKQKKYLEQCLQSEFNFLNIIAAEKLSEENNLQVMSEEIYTLFLHDFKRVKFSTESSGWKEIQSFINNTLCK